MQTTYIETQNVTFLDFKKQILEDYKLGRISVKCLTWQEEKF
jgi:hypothetical protein